MKTSEYLKIAIHLDCIEIDGIKSKWERSFCLENNVICQEIFEYDKKHYSIVLLTKVISITELNTAEKKLLEILDKIAIIWPIVTGYSLNYINDKTIKLPQYQSNKLELQEKFLRREGKILKKSSLDICYKIENKFRNPPMEKVLEIYKIMKNNEKIEKLLKYYNRSLLEKDCWFVHLYKVREQLKEIINKKEKEIIKELSIKNKDWDFFGRTLNNYDLRHIGKIKGKLPESDVRKVKILAREWIVNLLKREGASVDF